MPGSLKTIIPAGPDLVQASRSLGTAKRRAGTFPYQWMFPGPNSRHVRNQSTIDMTGFNPGDSADLDTTYQVPEGLRFSLRGVIVGSDVPDWEQASGGLLFTLRVQKVGPRNVDGLTNINTVMGSPADGPFPIGGRLEFNSLERLIWSVSINAPIVGPTSGFSFAWLWGHTYPDNEAGEG